MCQAQGITTSQFRQLTHPNHLVNNCPLLQITHQGHVQSGNSVHHLL